MARRYNSSAFVVSDYDLIRPGMMRSAAVIVPDVIELIEPTTVVDVGCGQGIWLAEFKQYGCEVHGFDGHDGLQFDIAADCYSRADLASIPNLAFESDLAICLEVAEHLPVGRAQWLVDTVCQAPIVLWSAAIPGQGGQGHVNEQWPGYWVDRFRSNGYEVSGALRSKWWDRVPGDVEVWYAQNILLCVRSVELARRPNLAPLFADAAGPLAVVHPFYWSHR